MTGHPDADVLARFREGLLARRRSARIRAHLARCERCASVERELKEISTLLASAPVPQMPHELTARLDRVLAAEAAARSGAPDEGSPERSPLPDRSSRPARRWRTPALRAAAAAAAVVVIAGGGYGVSRLVSQGGGTGAAATAPKAGPAQAQHAAAGSGSSAQGAQNGTSSRAAGQPAGSARVVHSGTDYVPGKLAAQAQALLARPASGFNTQSPLWPPGLATAALRGCVQLVTGRAQPLLVDRARYRGQPATIIVQAPAGGRPGQVWVVGTGCSARSKDVLAHTALTGSG
jgi:hypothetical protein